MTYLRTGLVSLALALALPGCGGLWRPFLEPILGPSASCGTASDPACDMGVSGPSSGDAMAVNLPPVWINESNPTLPDLKSVYVVKPGLALAVGAQATMVQWQTGSGWSLLSSQSVGPIYMSISGSAPDKMWIATSDGYAISYDGKGLQGAVKPCGTACTAGLTASWTSPLGSPWVVGLANEARRIPDGMTTWGALTVPNSVGQNLYAVWGASVTDVWFGTADGSAGTSLYHYNGVGFQTYPVPKGLPINCIWGRDSKDVWAVGDEGLILHWNGSAPWQQVDLVVAAGLALNSVAGNNAGEVWAVGDNGLILYYDGTKWVQVESMVQYPLYGVAVSPLDSYPIVVGSKGTTLRLGKPN